MHRAHKPRAPRRFSECDSLIPATWRSRLEPLLARSSHRDAMLVFRSYHFHSARCPSLRVPVERGRQECLPTIMRLSTAPVFLSWVGNRETFTFFGLGSRFPVTR